MKTRKNHGFTLVEILIVVVILGILAAIVIPQFSDASTQSRVSSLQSSLQTMRSQISLYKIQHNDVAPVAATFVAQMTTFSTIAGATQATKDVPTGYIYGPYLQEVPTNPFNNLSTIAEGAGASPGSNATGWWIDTNTSTIYANDNLSTDGVAHSTY